MDQKPLASEKGLCLVELKLRQRVPYSLQVFSVW
jgi:hypothetical protein